MIENVEKRERCCSNGTFMKKEDKRRAVSVAHVCSSGTSLVCMAQMGATAAAGGAVMGTMGAATSGSVPLITSVFQSIGLGVLLTLPANFYQILLVILLGLTIITSYLSYKSHQKLGIFSLVIISSLLIYSSIYILMSEPLYWIAFVLMLLSMVWNYNIGKVKSNGKVLKSRVQHSKKFSKGQTGIYFTFIIILIIITILGYFGFLAFAQNIAMLDTLPIVIVAVFAGLATFFSPCSFGLLPAYLSLYTKDKQKQKGTILKNGVSASLGLIAFNVILGIIIAFIGLGIGSAFSISAGGQLTRVTLTIRAIVGSILFILGILQFFHISIQGRLFKEVSQRLTFRKKGYSNYFFYGFGYNLGNIGCTGPIMAGLIILALASGFNAALFAFVIYSLTMAALMLTVSLLVGSIKINFLQESSHKIMKISAVVLMLAGLFIIGTVIYAKQFASLFFP